MACGCGDEVPQRYIAKEGYAGGCTIIPLMVSVTYGRGPAYSKNDRVSHGSEYMVHTSNPRFSHYRAPCIS